MRMRRRTARGACGSRPGRRAAQRPALFSLLCFKYLTGITPIPAPNPPAWLQARHKGALWGRARGEGAGGGQPRPGEVGGALGWLQVDSAIWVTWTESWGAEDGGGEGGNGGGDSSSSFSNPVSKDWESGGPGRELHLQPGLRFPAAQGATGGHEPGKPDAWVLIWPSLYIFRKCHHWDTLKAWHSSTNQPRMVERSPSSQLHAQEIRQAAQGFLQPQAHRVVGIMLAAAPRENHTLQGLAPPSPQVGMWFKQK
jgi:hypothetical protein